jgi:hypothetical protein
MRTQRRTLARTCLRLGHRAAGRTRRGPGGAIQRVGEVRRLGHYPRLGVEPEADLDHVAFGDPAGGTAGCADADNEPVAHRRDPAVPGVTADRDDHLRPAAGPEGVDNRRRNLDPGGVASGLDRG